MTAATTARATHEQDKGLLSVKGSIDDNPAKSGWAVDKGGIGKDQAAVFRLASPAKGPFHLTVTLVMAHPNPWQKKYGIAIY